MGVFAVKPGAFLRSAAGLAVPIALVASIGWTGRDEREERPDEAQALAGLSRRARTSIDDVIAAAGRLLDGDLSVAQREQLITIQSSCRTLAEMINEIGHSKPEPGRIDDARHPRRAMRSSKLSPQIAARVEPASAIRQRRVLVVDHIPAHQLLAQRMVEREGYAVETASSGVEALAALERGLFDLVLMDCAMPEMDGLAATRRIRERFARRPRVPIIAVAADALEHDREACLAAGMDGYLEQPLDRGTLGELLTLWLEGERETRAA